ncbi:MAG: glyceraldehyde 3-phosphate dehydrogenase NAD-binding domain-containing protein [Microcoleus sp.]
MNVTSGKTKPLRVAINGFGRIGRALFRICIKDPAIEIVAINDFYLTSEEIAYLCKYDSIYGVLPHTVELANDRLFVGGQPIKILRVGDLTKLQFVAELDIDVMVDASGDSSNFDAKLEFLEQCPFRTAFTNYPVNRRSQVYIYGAENCSTLTLGKIVFLGTCDANAVLPIYKQLATAYEIKSASIVTLHPYLSNQNLLDGKSPTPDLELGRASQNNLIPKTTSLEYIMKEYFPDRQNQIAVMSFRIPTNAVANANLHLVFEESISKQLLQSTLAEWCGTIWAGIGLYSQEKCVSIDYLAAPYSFIIDHHWIDTAGNQARISLWYDNEWGYSSRIYDFLKDVAKLA